MKSFIIFTSTLLLSNLSCYAQFSDLELKAIQDSIGLEINDTTKNKWVKQDLENMLVLLENPDSLFPFTAYDSVYYFSYGTTNNDFEPAIWNKIYKDYIFEKVQLSDAQINTVLKTVNNPTLFRWGECGTQFIENAIVFYKNEKEVARITCACSGGQLGFEPNNILARWGSFLEESHRIFYENLEN